MDKERGLAEKLLTEFYGTSPNGTPEAENLIGLTTFIIEKLKTNVTDEGGEKVCKDCGNFGQLRDEQENIIGICPCHY